MGLHDKRLVEALVLLVLGACVKGGHLPAHAQQTGMNVTSKALQLKTRFVDPATMTAALTAIIAGTSLASTTLTGLSENNYYVTVAIQVENWTRYPLMYPTVRLNAGALSTSPYPILPGQKEGFAVRKEGGTVFGTHGTVSWEVRGVERRFVIMWMAPYDFTYYSNRMGVGMTTAGVTEVASGNNWYKQMYDGQDGAGLKFKSKDYYYHMDPLIYSDDEFEIEAGMTNGHHAEIKVIFRTSENNMENLTPEIRKIMKSSSA